MIVKYDSKIHAEVWQTCKTLQTMAESEVWVQCELLIWTPAASKQG